MRKLVQPAIYAPPSVGDIKRQAAARKIRQLRKAKVELTPMMVTEALKATKKIKALGPDCIASIHLHYIGPVAVSFLTKLINLSLDSSVIPALWKVGRVIPLPKPDKDPEQAKSYRPLALLSPVAKLVEKLILPDFEKSIQLQDHQHGFKKLRSTTTSLQCLNHNIKSGLNKCKPCHRTLMVALDLKAAFDAVGHGSLLTDILNTGLPNYLKRWLLSYLEDRSTYTEFRESKLTRRKVKQGVP